MYTKSEHAPLKGRKTKPADAVGTVTVAKVMAKAEATHASGSKTTEGRSFWLEPNQAKHTSIGTEDFGYSEK
jgi:hypothetical protein